MKQLIKSNRIKPSTVMLIIILVLVPAYFSAKVLVLRSHFYAGDIKVVSPNVVRSESYRKIKIPLVKHIIIDGAVSTSNNTTLATKLWPKATIEQWEGPYGGEESLQFPRALSRAIRVRISKDSLFINFTRKKGPYLDATAPHLVIFLNQIGSVKSNFGDYKIKNLVNRNKISLTLTNSTVEFEGLNANKVFLKGSSETAINFPKENKVNELNYSLSERSKLNLQSLKIFSVFNPGELDSSSTISIAGSALDMQQYLKAQSKE